MKVRLINGNGGSVAVSTRGASIEMLRLPDREGRVADVCVSEDEREEAEWEIARCDACEVELERGVRRVNYVLREDNTLEAYLDNFVLPELRIKGMDFTLYINGMRRGDVMTDGQALDFTVAERLSGISCEGVEYEIKGWTEGVMSEVAVLADHATGRVMSVYSTFPVLRLSVEGAAGVVGLRCLPREWVEAKGRNLVFYEFRTI